MVGEGKFNIISMNQMKNEQMLVMVQMEQLQGTHGEARKDRPLPKHIN